MKQFLRRLSFFFLPLILLSYPIDLGISYLLRQSESCSGEYEVWSDIYDSKINCDLSIYGSSRAWVHIDPKILKDSLNINAYNFGIDGHNFWLQYLRHIEYMKHNKAPKEIILSLDLFTLQKIADLYKLEQFLPYMLWNKNMKEYTKSYNGFTTFDYYIPLIRYAGKFQVLKTSLNILFNGKSKTKTRSFGYKGMEMEWNSDFDVAKKNKVKYKINFDSNSIILFERFINECRTLNINLIFVYSPEYIEGQYFVSNRKELIEMYKMYANKYGLKFYDYSADEISFDQKLFYNALHLNKEGSIIFTRKLAHDLKEKTDNTVTYIAK